jgi:hypothetical protein
LESRVLSYTKLPGTARSIASNRITTEIALAYFPHISR